MRRSRVQYGEFGIHSPSTVAVDYYRNTAFLKEEMYDP